MNKKTIEQIKNLIQSKYNEVDVSEVAQLIRMGYRITAKALCGEYEQELRSYRDVLRHWDYCSIRVSHPDPQAPAIELGIFDECMSPDTERALDDYLDSCRRQGITFDEQEAKRFISESDIPNGDIPQVMNYAED